MTTEANPERSLSTGAPSPRWLPESQLIARIFAFALAALLAGYMFLGRGFAHIGIGPVYIGDWVLFLGVVTTAFVAIRRRVRVSVTWNLALLLGFLTLGAIRTIPYLGVHGLDALRDGALWGYGAFALIIYLLADRGWVLSALRLYGWVVPVFALWLPIAWNVSSASAVDPTRPGSFVPLVFFKGGDMAVHVVGAIAFLVIGASWIGSTRGFLFRMLICLPLLWTVFVAGTGNRGALLTAIAGIAVVGLLAPRSRNWLPILAAVGLFAIAGIFQGVLAAASGGSPVPSIGPTPIPAPTAIALRNAGFELGPLNDGTIEGWIVRGAGSHNIVADSAHRGVHSASMQNVARGYEDTITSSAFPIEPGRDIEVSVWVRAIVGRPIIEIYVNWYDSSGTLIKGDFLNLLPTRGLGTWQECAGAKPIPARATRAEVVLYEAQGMATMGIDEVTVRTGHFIAEPAPPKVRGRSATLQQLIDNLISVFGSSSDQNLEGTRQFRLAWWGKIVDYTVFGKYFWTGKGFGVNLADSDGFQTNADHSLRSPHNSEMTVLARMGVPGLLLWVLVQGAFAIGLLRAILANRRAGDMQVAAVGGWILAYWVAMMVDTSFDPYLEGPQGGIWFWVVFGLGLVVMRQLPRRRAAA